MDNSIAIAFLAGAGLSVIVYFFFGLIKRVRDLENSAARRHTHNTLDGLFDASALLLDLVLKSEIQSEVSRNIIRRVIVKLGQVSEDPYSYQEGSSERELLIEEALQRFREEMK